MYTPKNKGFTLIELLVVIAIIGILSSIVIASLNSARNKAADVALRKSLQEFYKKTQEYAIDNNIIWTTYSGFSWDGLNSAPDIIPGTSSIVKNIADNSNILPTNPFGGGQFKGIYVVSPGPTVASKFILIVVQSKTDDYLCIDTFSNRIYKLNNATFGTIPLQPSGCAAWQ